MFLLNIREVKQAFSIILHMQKKSLKCTLWQLSMQYIWTTHLHMNTEAVFADDDRGRGEWAVLDNS